MKQTTEETKRGYLREQLERDDFTERIENGRKYLIKNGERYVYDEDSELYIYNGRDLSNQ